VRWDIHCTETIYEYTEGRGYASSAREVELISGGAFMESPIEHLGEEGES